MHTELYAQVGTDGAGGESRMPGLYCTVVHCTDSIFLVERRTGSAAVQCTGTIHCTDILGHKKDRFSYCTIHPLSSVKRTGSATVQYTAPVSLVKRRTGLAAALVHWPVILSQE